jgi:hypothetical protein
MINSNKIYFNLSYISYTSSHTHFIAYVPTHLSPIATIELNHLGKGSLCVVNNIIFSRAIRADKADLWSQGFIVGVYSFKYHYICLPALTLIVTFFTNASFRHPTQIIYWSIPDVFNVQDQSIYLCNLSSLI